MEKCNVSVVHRPPAREKPSTHSVGPAEKCCVHAEGLPALLADQLCGNPLLSDDSNANSAKLSYWNPFGFTGEEAQQLPNTQEPQANHPNPPIRLRRKTLQLALPEETQYQCSCCICHGCVFLSLLNSLFLHLVLGSKTRQLNCSKNDDKTLLCGAVRTRQHNLQRPAPRTQVKVEGRQKVKVEGRQKASGSELHA